MDFISSLLKGVIVGLANVVPGLSAGTFLVMLGIYNRVMDAMGALVSRKVESIRSHLLFLISLGVGAAGGTLAFARLATLALDQHPVALRFLFIGLIGGSIPTIFRMHQDMRASISRIVVFAVGLGLAVSMGLGTRSEPGGQPTAEAFYLPRLFHLGSVGFLAGGAMITPGLSGSYIFLLGGTYRAVIQALGSLTAPPIHWDVLLLTALGAGLGILIFSKLIGLLLKRRPSAVLYAILGLVCGSFASLWPAGPALSTLYFPSILALAPGFAIAYILGRSSGLKQSEPHIARKVGET